MCTLPDVLYPGAALTPVVSPSLHTESYWYLLRKLKYITLGLFFLAWRLHCYDEAARLDLRFFTSCGLAWSTTSGSVSWLFYIVRPVFDFCFELGLMWRAHTHITESAINRPRLSWLRVQCSATAWAIPFCQLLWYYTHFSYFPWPVCVFSYWKL